MTLKEMLFTKEKSYEAQFRQMTKHGGFSQTTTHGNIAQMPFSDWRHSQLESAVLKGPNVIPEQVNRNPGRKRLRGSLDAFVKTCQRWRLKPDKQTILLGYEPQDSEGRHILSGDLIPSSQDFRDRIAYVLKISLGLGSVYNEVAEAELNWLNKLRPELNDKSALDHMLEGHMSNLMTITDLVEYERGL